MIEGVKGEAAKRATKSTLDALDHVEIIRISRRDSVRKSRYGENIALESDLIRRRIVKKSARNSVTLYIQRRVRKRQPLVDCEVSRQALALEERGLEHRVSGAAAGVYEAALDVLADPVPRRPLAVRGASQTSRRPRLRVLVGSWMAARQVGHGIHGRAGERQGRGRLLRGKALAPGLLQDQQGQAQRKPVRRGQRLPVAREKGA